MMYIEKFIERELKSKCYGFVYARYSVDRQCIDVEISTNNLFRCSKDVPIKMIADKETLTELVKSIKLDYINFLLGFYFKTSD
mgnify:CR=1 FL=1|jgi:hypothetical protein